MGNIVLLDDLTINKIAAGEVIERPASVVKELVENSIDAGANNITVEIKNGGISYIRITDNGKGFEPDDMEIAFERHATSKIRHADDLITVKSMGFRGEALASIAAISRIELKSKTENSSIGNKIVLEGGKILEKVEDGCPKGSTITIENLFYNTPVRYKFLRKDFTEAGYIEDAVTRIALSNPNIAIKLISSGKTVIQTSGNGDLKAIIYNIYGKEIAENIIDVNYEYEDIKVTGVIGNPSIARSNRANQLFFINKRFVKDKTLTSAAEQAFKGTIPVGKFGFLVLNLEINPEKLDVNVHPAKLEVRFEEENKVFKAVYHAIKENIEKNNSFSELNQESNKIFGKYDTDYNTKFNETTNNETNSYQENNDSFNSNTEETSKISLFQKLLNKNKQNEENEEDNNPVDDSNNFIAQIYQNRNENNKEDSYNTQQLENLNKEENLEENEEYLDSEDTNQEYNENLFSKEENIVEQENENLESEKLENQETQVVETITQTSESIDNQETQVMQIPLNNDNEPEIKQETVTYEEENFDEMYSSIFGTMPKQETKIEEEPEKYVFDDESLTAGENISIFEKTEEYKKPIYKFIGTAFKTCVIIEIGQDLYLIDQNAAKAKILFEEIKQNYYSQNKQQSQLMLLPDIINLNSKQMDIAKDNMEMYKKAGFTLEEFGDNTIKLTGVPNMCMELDTKELFIETLDKINTVAITETQEIEEKFMQTIANKVAEKTKMASTKEEVEDLIDNLLSLKNPFVTNNGKSIAIKMTRSDIEKKFSRR